MTDDHLLRTTLTINCWISTAWGLAATAGAGVLAGRLGLPTVAIATAGLVTLAAAALFWRFRSRDDLRALDGWVATLGDAVFGIGLLVVAVVAPEVTELGRWVVGVSGLAVLDLAVVEWIGLRRLTSPLRRSASIAS